jgi:hypothetical protein
MVTEWGFAIGIFLTWVVVFQLAKQVQENRKQISDLLSVVRVLRHHMMQRMQKEEDEP